MFEQYPESKVACVNEDGTLYGFPTYLQTPTAYAGTVYYRTDMFKEAGVSEPTTTDELLNAVKTVQEYYSAKDSEFIAFMPYTRTHVTSQLAYWLFPAFGDAVDMDYGTADGKTVAYNRISDQYRHMMEYLHELYISGGYYKECFSEDGTNTKPLIIGNHCAITTFGTMYSPDNFASGNYDVDMFAPLTSEYTSTQKYPKAYNSRMAASFVSSKCKDVETIMKWIDAFYTTTENPIADGVSGISMWRDPRRQLGLGRRYPSPPTPSKSPMTMTEPAPTGSASSAAPTPTTASLWASTTVLPDRSAKAPAPSTSCCLTR